MAAAKIDVAQAAKLYATFQIDGNNASKPQLAVLHGKLSPAQRRLVGRQMSALRSARESGDRSKLSAPMAELLGQIARECWYGSENKCWPKKTTGMLVALYGSKPSRKRSA